MVACTIVDNQLRSSRRSVPAQPCGLLFATISGTPDAGLLRTNTIDSCLAQQDNYLVTTTPSTLNGGFALAVFRAVSLLVASGTGVTDPVSAIRVPGASDVIKAQFHAAE